MVEVFRVVGDDGEYFKDSWDVVGGDDPVLISAFARRRLEGMVADELAWCEFAAAPDVAKAGELHAKCRNCGFAFWSSVIGEAELPNVYRRCSHTAQQLTPRLKVEWDGPSKATARLDGRPYEIDYTVAILLDALLKAGGSWVSGQKLAQDNQLFPGDHTTRVLNKVPRQIARFIERKPGRGSRLRFDVCD
jgi:hypothetical protein